jgi:hypothetical protein
MRKSLDAGDQQKLYRVSWSAYWVLMMLINLDIMYRMYIGQPLTELFDLFLLNFIGMFGMVIIMLYFYSRRT